jgi:hypothetical protein
MFAARSIVNGSKDVPTPSFLPARSQDTFKGIRALASLIEPALSWASRTEQKYSKSGVTIPLFDKMKNVDDAIRNGLPWMEQVLADAAKYIPSDAEQAKKMLPFLQVGEETQIELPKISAGTRGAYKIEYPQSRTPMGQLRTYEENPEFDKESVWKSMAKQLGVDDAFLDKVRGLNKLLMDYQQQTGTQVMNYLHHDLGRLQNFDYSVQAVWPRGLDKTELSRIPQAIVNQEFNPQDPHVGHFVAWLVRDGFEKKFTEQPLRELSQLMNLKDAEGKSILGVNKFAVQQYIDYVRGVPDVTQRVMTATIANFQNALGKGFADVNKRLGTKLPTEFLSKDLFQKFIMLSYAGNIAGRSAIWARDAMQAITNSLPVVGPTTLAKGIAKLFVKGTWEKAAADGATMGMHNFEGMYGDVFQELSPQSGGTFDKVVDVSSKLLSPSRWFHNIARVATYSGAYDQVLRGIELFRANKIGTKELLEDHSAMWFFDTPLQTRLLRQLTEKDGKAFAISNEEMAKKVALETVDSTLWAYRRGTQPLFLRTGVGRIFGQFGLWPLSYLDFLRRLTGKLADNPKKAIVAAALWATANKAATSTFEAAGGDVSKWFFLSPAGYGGSPHLQAALAAGQSLENSEQGREARKTLLEYPMNFVPAYLELKNVAGWIADGGTSNFVNGDGTLTPDAVKILGMHPKSQELDLTPEEELEYQMGFSHRR